MPPAVIHSGRRIGGRLVRVVDGNDTLPSPVIEVCTGRDAMDGEIWQRLTEQSPASDLWEAVQVVTDQLRQARGGAANVRNAETSEV